MAQESTRRTDELQGLLRRLQEGHEAFTAAIEQARPQDFERERQGSRSLKWVLERAVDDLNLYYGRLVANALSLPQPPYLEPSDFASLAEAKASLQTAHRRFSNLLHDLRPTDLKRRAAMEAGSEFKLREVLEMTIAHYKLRAEQVKAAGKTTAKKDR